MLVRRRQVLTLAQTAVTGSLRAWAALRFTLALASLDLGLCLGRPIDADDQTAPATPAVPISFGSSTRTCRPDASGIVAALMSCAFLSGCRS